METASKRKPVVPNDLALSVSSPFSPLLCPQPRPFSKKKINPFPAPFPALPSPPPHHLLHFQKPRRRKAKQASPQPITRRTESSKEAFSHPPDPQKFPYFPENTKMVTKVKSLLPRILTKENMPSQRKEKMEETLPPHPASGELNNVVSSTLDFSVRCKRCKAYHSKGKPCKNSIT